MLLSKTPYKMARDLVKEKKSMMEDTTGKWKPT